MTLEHLAEVLNDLVSEGYGAESIKMVYQSNYPIVIGIEGVNIFREEDESDGDRDGIYIVSSDETDYGVREMFDNIIR